MEFWFLAIGVVVLYFGYPYARCFFKRLSICSKLKKKCREKGYTLQRTHRFWFLGGRYGKKCDLFIETEEELLAIKLFNIPRRRRVLIFTEDNGFFVRRFFRHMSINGVFSWTFTETHESKKEALPEYDFDCDGKPMVENKCLHKLLLVNPVPEDIRMKPHRSEEYSIFPGEMIGDMEFVNASGLLMML